MMVLFDVDNTLLDTDRAVRQLRDEMRGSVGEVHARRFWEIYEEVRSAMDTVNIPETLERFAGECADLPAVNRVAEIIYGFDFGGCMFAGALEAVAHGVRLGGAAIFSDGDQLFQRHKIIAAGLERAVGGNVMVQKHKEQALGRMKTRFPAEHYVAVDDKAGVLRQMKAAMGRSLTAIQVSQGKYARNAESEGVDIGIATIGEFTRLEADELLAAARGA